MNDYQIAVKHDGVIITPDGTIGGHDSAATLVRRILRVFPGSAVIGPAPRRCEGFDVIPLEFCDPESTIVVNMDVLDSLAVARTLRRGNDRVQPMVMNFLWWPPSTRSDPMDRAALALSCAMVPTFADSERTAREVTEVVARWTVAPLAERARISWVNLGFRLDHVQPRQDTEVPVVLYPATALSARKRPNLFVDVVSEVHEDIDLRVEMRLVESHLTRDLALRMSRKDWFWIGPLTATRGDYWSALARTTAFLATSSDESYGMEYVEALAAGAVGIFPDLPWVEAMLPAGYPLRYRTHEEAVSLLRRAITQPQACRAEVDAAIGGSLGRVLRDQHSDAGFDRALRQAVADWFEQDR